jgi:hypothetical protein
MADETKDPAADAQPGDILGLGRTVPAKTDLDRTLARDEDEAGMRSDEEIAAERRVSDLDPIGRPDGPDGITVRD